MASGNHIGRHRRLAEKMRREHRFASEHPRLYRLRIILFALLGHAYFALFSLTLLGSITWLLRVTWQYIREGEAAGRTLVLIYFLLPALLGAAGCVFSILKAATQVPEGLILRREDAPELFATIDELCRQLKVRRIHRVLLNEEFNAGVAMIPRFSGLAGTRYYLAIGLPLMQGLTTDQLRAVIAHELGHISGRLNRLRLWLYKHLRQWEMLHSASKASNLVAFLLVGLFVRWYVPRLRILMSQMLRGMEFEADRIAASIVGPEGYSRVLSLVNTRSHFIRTRFWTSVTERMTRQAQPDDDIYFQLRQSLKNGIDARHEVGLLRWTLAERPEVGRHPTLQERLEAVGVFNPQAQRPLELFNFIPRNEQSAAAASLLGQHEEELTRVLSMKWKAGIAPFWREEFSSASIRESYRYDLQRQLERGEELAAEDFWLLCRLTEEFSGPREAFEYYRAYLEQHRADPKANFAFGRIFIEQDDARGLPYIEYAMEADPFHIPAACQLIAEYYYRNVMHEQAQPYEERAAEFASHFAEARAERAEVDAADEFYPHDLPREQVEAAVLAISRLGSLRRAWLAGKAVAHFPERPVYVLALEVNSPSDWPRYILDSLAQLLDVPFHVIAIVNERQYRRVFRKIRLIEGSLIFDAREVTE